jgi:aspartyl-tRNA(Asn)/glutamyl-tRNA(Gln) amidotransferase subunit A
MEWPRTAAGLRDAAAAGRVGAREVCEAVLARIDRLDPALHAFHTIARQRALETADRLDRSRAEAGRLPLFAVPVAVKDNICVRGLPATACSRILEHFQPPYDATAVARLEAAGAIVVGKTVCDEFGMGSSTENSAFGGTRNPWARDRTPGGSSGGSAAAVAARLVPLALGSDTGGSIRQPAALCGIVGLKPTWGRVSRYGLLAFASSLDQIGPLTATVGDAALALGVMAGSDDADATAARREAGGYREALTGAIEGARIGVPRRMLAEGVEPDVAARFEDALSVLRGRGAMLVDVELPHSAHAIPVYYLVATAEASSNLARYDGIRYGLRVEAGPEAGLAGMYDQTRARGFGAEVKRRIMLGTYALSAGYYEAYYLKAQQVRTLIRRDFEAAFGLVEAIALPTSPTAAFRLGERVDDPLQMYLADVFTVGASLAGLPALSIPCGLTSERLPVGLQLVGRAFDEATLLRIGDVYERDTEWAAAVPPLAADEGSQG